MVTHVGGRTAVLGCARWDGAPDTWAGPSKVIGCCVVGSGGPGPWRRQRKRTTMVSLGWPRPPWPRWLWTSSSPLVGRPYDRRCDLWSVGVLLFLLLSGQMPFDSTDVSILKSLHKDSWSNRGSRTSGQAQPVRKAENAITLSSFVRRWNCPSLLADSPWRPG